VNNALVAPVICLLGFGFTIVEPLLAQEAVEFDRSPFASFSYDGVRLVEPRITSIAKSGVVVTEKNNKNSVVVPLDDALKHPELRMRAKNAIEACIAESSDEANSQRSDAPVDSAIKTTEPRKLRKTERSQMEQAVWGAGLVSHRYDARKLSDEELRELHIKAQPILEVKGLRRELNAIRDALR
jgi:hypothetical protein